ncbi:DeSI-like protein [Hibiscus syriacus]|uniref:DeSI-like protein n=1 Tax=Hibiscus syriacus TaxID=106335 RepID=A0A6A3BBE8_HIBSY|nr:DeSI-like protein [Hibiscus syriacus]
MQPKHGWHSIIPLRFRGSSSTRLCFSECKVSSRLQYWRCDAPVYLNVYDLTTANDYVYWAGLGIFHTGVEVQGVEYPFGAHDYPTSGVFEVEPRQCPGFKFRKSIFMGTTCLDPVQLRVFMEHQSASYNGDSNHLIFKSCNHFCDDMCYKLTGNHIPKWVNRLARIGSLCNCILPEALKASAVRHDPNSHLTEKRKE